MVRVLGIDPGLTRCGIGVVEGAPGRQLRMVDVDVFRTPTSLPTPERLLSLQADIDTWVRRYHPDAVAIERVFADVNVSSVMGTAQASAVAMLAAASRGIPVHLHTPTEVKAAVTGSGTVKDATIKGLQVIRDSGQLDPQPQEWLETAIKGLQASSPKDLPADARRTLVDGCADAGYPLQNL